MNKKQEERIEWFKKTASKLTYREEDGKLFCKTSEDAEDILITEDGHFRFAAEGGKGTDTGHVLFVGYFDNNKPPMELPLPQEPEQYKHLKWPPDPWWK